MLGRFTFWTGWSHGILKSRMLSSKSAEGLALINVSVILPTRGRPEGLRRCIESVLRTAAHPEAIEFLIRIDLDDVPTRQAIGEVFLNDLWLSGHLRFIQGKQVGHEGNQEMNWELCQIANGKFLFFLNDDAVIYEHHPLPAVRWDAPFSDCH